MGSTSCLSFHQTPYQRCFLCRQCRTHIGLAEDLLARHPQLDETAEAIFKENLVNVFVEEELRYRVQRNLVTGIFVYVYCDHCGSRLGTKVLFAAAPEIPFEHRTNKFFLGLNKLLLKTGTRIYNADTHEQVSPTLPPTTSNM